MGVGALVVASVTITDVSQVPWWVPDDVSDRVAFARAGTMHNFSYLGGAVGILIAWIYLAIERIRFDRKARRDTTATPRPARVAPPSRSTPR